MLEAVYLKVVSLTYPYQRLTARISASGRDVPSPLKEKDSCPGPSAFFPLGKDFLSFSTFNSLCLSFYVPLGIKAYETVYASNIYQY